MSGSETGVMASRGEHFSNVGLQKSPLSAQPMIQNMRVAFSPDGTAVYKPIAPTSPSYQSPNGVNGGGGGGGGGLGAEVPAPAAGGTASGINMNAGGEQPVKKKRGRPRKYGPEGPVSLAIVSTAPVHSSGGFSSPTSAGAASEGPTSPTLMKKSRGRPPGSSNKKHQVEALGSAGTGFMPHVITVKAGEDVSSKIMSFLQHGSRAVCILSANGAISNVTLRQPATSGGTVTYEGRFEILSLSGSFLLSEVGGQRSRTGGLSVSLSGPDGRVLGGGVAGLLTAASPVQVVVGSFIADGVRKESKSALNQTEPAYAPTKVSSSGGGIGASSPPWDGTLSESSGGGGSPLNQGTGACNNSGPHGISSMPWK